MSGSSLENPSEGWVVLAAGLLMAVVVGGSVSWQSWRGGVESTAEAVALGVPEDMAIARAEVERMKEEMSALELKVAESEADLAFARDASERAKQESLDARARVHGLTEQQQAKANRLEEENRALRLEVQALLTRNQGLQEQVTLLSEAASDAVAERASSVAAPPTSGSVEPPTASPGAHAWSGPVRVVDGNESLRYVVLSAGSDVGVESGMLFTVVEQDRPIADVRADDVREEFTGAVVERTYPGERFPRSNDRAVVRKRVE